MSGYGDEVEEKELMGRGSGRRRLWEEEKQKEDDVGMGRKWGKRI